MSCACTGPGGPEKACKYTKNKRIAKRFEKKSLYLQADFSVMSANP